MGVAVLPYASTLFPERHIHRQLVAFHVYDVVEGSRARGAGKCRPTRSNARRKRKSCSVSENSQLCEWQGGSLAQY